MGLPRVSLWRLLASVVWCIGYNIGDHALFIAAAGIAFYGMLAAFPAVAAFISVYALWANPIEAVHQFSLFRNIMPDQAWQLFHQQLMRLTAERGSNLGVGAFFGLTITLWSAGAGVRALLTALNFVYLERERRGLLRFYLVAIGFTIGTIAIGVVSLTTIVVAPILLKAARLGAITKTFATVIRWPIILTCIVAILVLFYKYGPSRTPPKLRWTLPGAIFATVGWFAASFAFSFYVASFANYNETYGTLGAVVILLIWFYISAFLVLIGAELNATLEHMATVDTTEGEDAPRGQRGATVADTRVTP